MKGRIRAQDVDEVKARTNIADIVSEQLNLKSAGADSLKGLCPFHDERSPSFHVRPGAGYYHCFGCGESGDVYSFLQRTEQLSFAESVEKLAARIGYQLHYEDGTEAAGHSARARLFSANRVAADFFVSALRSQAAQPGRLFLGERGFDARAAAQFGVGFAPAGWEELTRVLRAEGFSDEELLAAGLVSQGKRGVYDRFRGRLVWPIKDVTGQIVGFGARRLLADDPGPKYLNTPDTVIYHKAQVLYGLDMAKREIAASRRVVVVEGYTDVMACHLAGVGTAVATCGTAFGVEHIRLLRRVLGDDSGLGEVIFTFDPDEAGRKAAIKAFSEERRFSAQTFVALAPEGLDPCDLRLRGGDSAVRGLIDARVPMFEFVIRHTLDAYDLETVEGRAAALRAAAPIVADIRDPAVRPGYARELARMLGVELDEVRRAVRKAGSTPRPVRVTTGVQNSSQSHISQKQVEPEELANGDPSAAPATRTVPSLSELAITPAVRLERDALQAILQHPELLGSDLIRGAVDCRLSSEALAVVRDGIAAAWSEASQSGLDVAAGSVVVDRVLAAVPTEYADLVRQLAVLPIPERHERDLSSYIRGVAIALIDRDLRRQTAELLGRLQRVPRGDSTEYRRIQRALMEVESARRQLTAE